MAPTTRALELTIALPGLDALTVGLTRMRTEIADWSPFWRQYLIPFFYRDMLLNFATEGGNSGASWAALSPAYAIAKAKKWGGGLGILERSGALKASLTSPDAPWAIARPTATGLELGTAAPYAMFHQLGTASRGRSSRMRKVTGYEYGAGLGMPARPPLRVAPGFVDVLGKSLKQFVQSAWAGRRGAIPIAA